MFKVKLSVDLNNLKKQVKESLAVQTKREAEKLLAEIKEETPVDTGLARDSWKLEYSNLAPTQFTISNDQDYIKYLNAGSSQQAPARFLETTALRHGKPVGPIVRYED